MLNLNYKSIFLIIYICNYSFLYALNKSVQISIINDNSIIINNNKIKDLYNYIGLGISYDINRFDYNDIEFIIKNDFNIFAGIKNAYLSEISRKNDYYIINSYYQFFDISKDAISLRADLMESFGIKYQNYSFDLELGITGNIGFSPKVLMTNEYLKNNYAIKDKYNKKIYINMLGGISGISFTHQLLDNLNYSIKANYGIGKSFIYNITSSSFDSVEKMEYKDPLYASSKNYEYFNYLFCKTLPLSTRYNSNVCVLNEDKTNIKSDKLIQIMEDYNSHFNQYNENLSSINHLLSIQFKLSYLI